MLFKQNFNPLELEEILLKERKKLFYSKINLKYKKNIIPVYIFFIKNGYHVVTIKKRKIKMNSYKIIYSDGTKGYIKALNIIRALATADKKKTVDRIIAIYEYKQWPMISKIIKILKRPKLKIIKK